MVGTEVTATPAAVRVVFVTVFVTVERVDVVTSDVVPPTT